MRDEESRLAELGGVSEGGEDSYSARSGRCSQRPSRLRGESAIPPRPLR